MGSSLHDSFDQVVAKVRQVQPEADLTLLQSAFDLLVEHRSPVRVQHALETAAVLAGMRLDIPAITASLVVPLGDRVPPETLEQKFGSEVARLGEAVRRLDAVRWDRIESEAAETLRKTFIAIAADVRVVIIALAIRVQRMRALSESDDKIERLRLARETRDLFAPLANRLGIWQLKSALEDLALRELEPEVFHELETLLSEKRAERAQLIEQAIRTIREKLDEHGIKAKVYGRSKHLASIYKKMVQKKVGLDQIHDVAAVRIITDKITDCYAALGIIHSVWVPIPGQFDDYIARPKENLYQSLHTTVVGPGGKPIEVQIRTAEMHHYAEYGVAAHWAYKEGRKSLREADKKFMVLRQLMDWEREVSDPHQFAESLKTDIFKDQVYVFTPAGDIIDLPVGSTPLDFAYRIHTMVGHRCRGARVNDQIVPLDYQLKTGDRVEILTHKKPAPSRDWMNPAFGYLKTTSARAKVRAWFREQGKDDAVQQGKEIVDRELSRLALQHVTVADLCERLGYETAEDLYEAVGFGVRNAPSVASAALQIERERQPPPEPEIPPVEPEKGKAKAASGLSLSGVEDILGRRARCCNPVPGDQVVGFVSRGRGISIHRRDCPHIVGAREPERIVEIDWGGAGQERYPVDVEIRAHDRPGLLRDLSDLVAQSGVKLRAARADARDRDGKARLRFSLEFANADEAVRLIARIDRHPDVLEVRRIGH